jgi:class 3 adenylate cyclase
VEIKHVVLVLADISGYTRFMRVHTMSLLHAEAIITDLLEAVIDAAEFPLTLSKLEGDAAFLYATVEDDSRVSAAAQDILRQVTAFFEAFTRGNAL